MAKLNNKGQSAMEFILTFTASFGFIFLFLKMATNYTDGYMVHHATYFAGRAYLVRDENRQQDDDGDNKAYIFAKSVFTSYLPEGLVPNVDASKLEVNTPEDGKVHAYVGVFARYQSRFSMGLIGGTDLITFVSEAFLGREPTRRESRDQVCMAIKSIQGLGKCDLHVTLEDNGG